MSFDFTSNNHYVQVGVNLGNTYTSTEPRSVSHSQDTLVSESANRINAATAKALVHALIKAQRFLAMAQDIVSERIQLRGVVEHLDILPLDIKDLSPEQWDSSKKGL